MGWWGSALKILVSRVGWWGGWYLVSGVVCFGILYCSGICWVFWFCVGWYNIDSLTWWWLGFMVDLGFCTYAVCGVGDALKILVFGVVE